MKNKKAIIDRIYLITLIVILAGIGLFVIFTSLQQFKDASRIDYFTNITDFVYISPVLLTPVGDGLTSFSATVKNRTWLDWTDASEEYVVSNGSDIELISNFTVVAMVKKTHEADGGPGVVFAYGKAASASTKMSDFHIFIENSAAGAGERGYLGLNVGNGSSVYSRYSTDIRVPFENWTFIAAGIKSPEPGERIGWVSSNLRNSVQETNFTNFTYVANGKDITIGTPYTGAAAISGDMNGSIDYVIVFNQTLSDNQLHAIQRNNGRITHTVYTENKTLQKYDAIWIDEDGHQNHTLIAAHITHDNAQIETSLDQGHTWTWVANVSRPGGTFFDSSYSSVQTLQQDSKNNTYLSATRNFGQIFVSPANSSGGTNLTNWINVFNMSCDNGTTLSHNNFIEYKEGFVAIGEYSQNNRSEPCAMIYNSSDGGLNWTIMHNDTLFSAGLSYVDYGRHMHFVQQDPYTDYIYASIGDGVTRRKLIRSTNYGATFEVISYSNESTAQPTAIVFSPTHRYLGADSPPYSGIFRSSNDTFWTQVHKRERGYWNIGFVDDNGIIYFGNTDTSTQRGILLASSNGIEFYNVYEVPSGTGGFGSVSNIVSGDDWFWTRDQYNTRMKYLPALSSLFEFRLNEVSNTVAHDAGLYKFNGTITGATWDNNGIDNTLVRNVDYNLTNSNGLFTLLDDFYSYSSINTTRAYSIAGDSRKAIVETEEAILVFPAILGLIVVIFMISIVLIIVLKVISPKQTNALKGV